ncbi:MAG: GNAT family N-acetyltransferase [Candidatus Eremiobacteraeota bacterium]|nr:GNAT family N-acetyltransferase [Candidatus Eremiobacteraeota bacterium]
MRVERLGDKHRRAAVAFLERKPYENVFLIHASLYASPAIRTSLHVALDDVGEIAGVAFFGRQVVPAANDDALKAFVDLGVTHKRERMIVGPLEQVAHYWELVGPRHTKPSAIRQRQPLLAVTPGSLRGENNMVHVRLARAGDCDEITGNAAQMIEGELGYDPRDRSPGDFEAGVAQMIERELWWVGEDAAGLCFQLNVGPYSDQTTQLQGIFTSPTRRGHGLATASLAGICRRLLEESPSLSLFVNDFNTAALQLYGRTGFEEVGAFRSILF